MERILLGQLGANGDCLYATTLARQLRQDYPRAEICWAISNACAPLLRNNPYVDSVWKIPVRQWARHDLLWSVFEHEAHKRVQRKDFDFALLTQIWPSNFQHYDGTVRASIFRSYGRKLSVPIENVIALCDDEIERVEEFAASNGLAGETNRVLFECSARSGQSFMTPDKAQDVAAALYELLPDARVVLSTHMPVELRDRRTVYGGGLSLREIAHLTHHVDLFVGAGSGGTVAVTSSAARVLPMIQLLSKHTSVFASFAHDFDYFGQSHRPVLESTNEDPVEIARAIAAALKEGLPVAGEEFGCRIPVRFEHYFNQIGQNLLGFHRFLDAARSLLVTAERYGWTRELVTFATENVVPFLRHDESWFFPPSRRIAELLQGEVADAGEGADAARLDRRYSDESVFLRPAITQ